MNKVEPLTIGKKLNMKYQDILSSRGNRIKVSAVELKWLNECVQKRELRPFCLSWERLRQHPDLQINGGTEEEQEAIWADRKRFYIQGWNAPIMMDDATLVAHKPVEKPKDDEQGKKTSIEPVGSD